MIRLEDLQPKTALAGILPDALVRVVTVRWFGSEALELTYKTPIGRVASEPLTGMSKRKTQGHASAIVRP